MPRRDQLFESVTTEGALLPSDFLNRLAQRDREIQGLTPDAYHLGSGEKLNEAISRSLEPRAGRVEKFRPGVAATSGFRRGHHTHPREMAAAALSGTRLRSPANRQAIRVRGSPLLDLARLAAHAHSPRQFPRRPRYPFREHYRRTHHQSAQHGAGIPEPLYAAPVGYRE